MGFVAFGGCDVLISRPDEADAGPEAGVAGSVVVVDVSDIAPMIRAKDLVYA